MIGFLHHELFVRHLEGYNHVERPERLTAIMERIKASPVADRILFREAEPAEREWLELVHDPAYIDGILSLEIDDAVILDWGDTVATPATPQAALLAAGAGVQATSMVLSGEVGAAFCAVRPPGHHAERNRAMGFCIFNNIAVAAAELLGHEEIDRVAVIDWDVHHGNGTERMFEDRDEVLYISTHQYPHYPGTGHAGTVGTGRGEGFNLNIPLGAGSGDAEYIDVFEHRILPALDGFEPSFILISAGFDAHGEDPLSGMILSSETFGKMTSMLRDAADRHCAGRIVSFLEGGYDIESLAESVECHLTALVD